MQTQQTIEVKRVLIDPFIANEMLKLNTRNRRLKQHIVDRYTKEMKQNRWKEDTGEMIKISKSNAILDGQHRLHAIVKANVSLNLHIITGLEDDVFDVIDTGSLRSGADCFLMEKIGSPNYLPSIISLYEAIKKGKYETRVLNVSDRFSNTQLLSLYYERQTFWDDSVLKTVRLYKAFSKILAPSIIGGFYATFYDKNTAQADDFMTQLCTGLNISNNTIGLLRNKLISDKISNLKMDSKYKSALIIKTWNLFRKKDEVKHLKFDSSIEKFPTII